MLVSTTSSVTSTSCNGADCSCHSTTIPLGRSGFVLCRPYGFFTIVAATPEYEADDTSDTNEASSVSALDSTSEVTKMFKPRAPGTYSEVCLCTPAFFERYALRSLSLCDALSRDRSVRSVSDEDNPDIPERDWRPLFSLTVARLPESSSSERSLSLSLSISFRSRCSPRNAPPSPFPSSASASEASDDPAGDCGNTERWCSRLPLGKRRLGVVACGATFSDEPVTTRSGRTGGEACGGAEFASPRPRARVWDARRREERRRARGGECDRTCRTSAHLVSASGVVLHSIITISPASPLISTVARCAASIATRCSTAAAHGMLARSAATADAPPPAAAATVHSPRVPGTADDGGLS
eukprot:Rhum_TRINITY_DN9140_c0_g1::Rhum_TRINITY_DN9140_c0_g1_i1::g.31722::m.31722